MTILAMLLAATAPRFVKTGERLRAEQWAFELRHLLRYGHELAVARNVEVLWLWDPARKQARLAEVVPGADGSAASLRDVEGSNARSAVVEFEATVARELSDPASAVGCPPAVAATTLCVPLLPDGSSESVRLILHAGDSSYTITIDGATSEATLPTWPADR